MAISLKVWSKLKWLIIGIASAVFVLVTIGTVASIKRNAALQAQLNTLKLEDQRLELQKQSTTLNNRYYQSSEYLEIMAKRLYSRGKEGERMIIIDQKLAELALSSAPLTRKDLKTTPKTYSQYDWLIPFRE